MDATPNNNVGVQKEERLSPSDLTALDEDHARRAFEDIKLNVAALESLQAELPPDIYEEQRLQLLLQLISLHEALESAEKTRQLAESGAALLKQAMKTEGVELLDKCLADLQTSANFTPNDHPGKAGILDNLAIGFQARFERAGDLRDLERAIDANRHLVELTPDDHQDKPRHLNNLGRGFINRFERVGELGDLERGIDTNQRAINLTPDSHPVKPSCLNDLGNGFLTRFELRGELEDLEHAIDAYRRAIELTPDGHADKPSCLSNLGNSLLTRFDRHGELGDLERAIDVNRHAIDLAPNGHPDEPIYLNNLGNCFFRRFQRHGELGDLEHGIDAYRRAVDLVPDGYFDKPAYLSNLGSGFFRRFERVGELEDLERAINTNRRAVDLTPDGHPYKLGILNNLGIGFQRRFERVGELGDLEGAIDANRRTVDLTSNDHPNKPGYLNNLGVSFSTRFEHLGELEDLGRAIDAHRRAVDLAPDDHPNKPSYLSNLGSGFGQRFTRHGELEDLECAIDANRRAVDLTPDGHPYKPVTLSNLGHSFLIRLERYGGLEDIERAIDASRRAVDLVPDGHPSKPAALGSFGTAFFRRFERLGELGDLERAIDVYRRVIDLIPDGHPAKPTCFRSLGNGFFRRFQRFGKHADLQDALEVYLRAADQQSGPPTIRLSAVELAVKICWLGLQHNFVAYEEFVNVFERAIMLIPQVAWLGNSIGQRFEELARIGQLVNGAVAATIAAGQLTKAVEWLDQGRGVVWEQLLQLRTPLDDLRGIRPDLATRLESLAWRLEGSSGLFNEQSIQESAAQRNLEDEASKRIGLAEDYKSTLDEIRKIEGFERFLMPKPFSVLAGASTDGPVVMVNVDELRCDALVLLPSRPILHVPLPKLTPTTANAMSAGFTNHLPRRPVRGAAQESDEGRLVDLECLWSYVVQPVLQAIDEEHAWHGEDGESLPHITWCPTGPLSSAPFHAAGSVGSESGENAFERVVSSYAPYLSVLLRPPIARPITLSDSDNILIVSQPQTLPAVDAEVKLVQDALAKCNVIHLDRSSATVEAVLAAMESHAPAIIHLACHGVQNAEDPTKSAFILEDTHLELSRLMATTTTDGAALAVLSACQTATGDAKLPEEAVHLAAGMLSVGYRAVVGTLWSIEDEDAPLVAAELYAQLKRDVEDRKRQGNGRLRVAYALHAAVAKLRERVGVKNTERWAPYAHFGL